MNCFHSSGFQLHKWASNSQDLMRLIESDQNSKRTDEPQPKTKFRSLENEQSFAKLSIEAADKSDLDKDGGKPTKVLGITWDCESDQLIFDLKSLSEFGKSLKLTKRNLLRLIAKLFDSLRSAVSYHIHICAGPKVETAQNWKRVCSFHFWVSPKLETATVSTFGLEPKLEMQLPQARIQPKI